MTEHPNINVRQPTGWPRAATPPSFQSEVDQWMDACFGEQIKADQLERGDRFIEEALELAQTMPGFGADRAHALVDYVFSRPVGDRFQEVGGVMVTLAALCNAAELDIRAAAAFELARVWTKVEAIRAKQAAKPTGSALPVAVTPEAEGPEVRTASAPRPLYEWHEDHGPVLWWLWPIEQEPYVGTPLDLGRTVSFDITVQIGIDIYETVPAKIGDTGGWPWLDADDETTARLFWTPLPDASALDGAIRNYIRGGPDPFEGSL